MSEDAFYTETLDASVLPSGKIEIGISNRGKEASTSLTQAEAAELAAFLLRVAGLTP